MPDAHFDSHWVSDRTSCCRRSSSSWVGKEKAFLRHASAVYLKATSPDVNCSCTLVNGHNMVEMAYANGEFEMYTNMLETTNEYGSPF